MPCIDRGSHLLRFLFVLAMCRDEASASNFRLGVPLQEGGCFSEACLSVAGTTLGIMVHRACDAKVLLWRTGRDSFGGFGWGVHCARQLGFSEACVRQGHNAWLETAALAARAQSTLRRARVGPFTCCVAENGSVSRCGTRSARLSWIPHIAAAIILWAV